MCSFQCFGAERAPAQGRTLSMPPRTPALPALTAAQLFHPTSPSQGCTQISVLLDSIVESRRGEAYFTCLPPVGFDDHFADDNSHDQDYRNDGDHDDGDYYDDIYVFVHTVQTNTI